MVKDWFLLSEALLGPILVWFFRSKFEQGGTCGVFLSVRSKLGVLGVLVLGVIVTEEKQS